MQIIYRIPIELTRRSALAPLDAVQGDGSARAVKISLLENGAPWEVPEGITAAVAFRKADGHKGLYDTLPDGTKAVTVDGSAVTAVLAPQVLSCAGNVSAAVVFYDADLQQLATFPFTIRVEKNPAAGQEISNDYYRYSSMEAVSQAVEDALASLENEKQDFLAQAQEALQTVHDTAGEDAPAIVCEATGESISVTDAAGRPLQGLTLYGKTVQSGTPTPENPVPLESLGASGAITVSVTDAADASAQTVTVATEGGLPGIPVTSGGNYTDENGQAWICDEVDFARGVYARRIGRKLFNGSEQWDATGNNFIHYNDEAPIRINPPMMSSAGRVTHSVQDAGGYGFCYAYGFRIRFENMNPEKNTVAELKAYLAENPIEAIMALKTPIETALSAQELAAFAALHSSKPNTTVFNDAGAEMKLVYTADTKTYIDRKLAAISAAMLNT